MTKFTIWKINLCNSSIFTVNALLSIHLSRSRDINGHEIHDFNEFLTDLWVWSVKNHLYHPRHFGQIWAYGEKFLDCVDCIWKRNSFTKQNHQNQNFGLPNPGPPPMALRPPRVYTKNFNFERDFWKMPSKRINSITNGPRKLFFGQNVGNNKAKKVTEGIFDFLKISHSVAIFRWKMDENCNFCYFWPFFLTSLVRKHQKLKISKIPSVTFFA